MALVARNGHGHCPLGCEHPQSFEADGRRLCGKCWFEHEVVTEMVPCTPDACPDLPADAFVVASATPGPERLGGRCRVRARISLARNIEVDNKDLTTAYSNHGQSRNGSRPRYHRCDFIGFVPLDRLAQGRLIEEVRESSGPRGTSLSERTAELTSISDRAILSSVPKMSSISSGMSGNGGGRMKTISHQEVFSRQRNLMARSRSIRVIRIHTNLTVHTGQAPLCPPIVRSWGQRTLTPKP